MSKIKGIAIAALLLLIVGIFGAMLTYHTNAKSVSFEKTLSDSFTKLDINADNENIKIIPTKDTETKVKLSGKAVSDYKQDYSVKVEDSTLRIQLREQQVKFFSFDFSSIFTPLTLKIYVPEKLYNSFVIDNDNGEIQTGNLKIHNLKLSTNNGRIIIKNTTAGNVDVQSDNGSISFEGNISGKIAGKTNNGKISISVPSIDHPIQLESDNGSIIVQTNQEPDDVTYDLHSDNGSINIFDKYKSGSVVGNGSNLIRLTTNNGKITITK